MSAWISIQEDGKTQYLNISLARQISIERDIGGSPTNVIIMFSEANLANLHNAEAARIIDDMVKKWL